jgi:hypothetical protein
MTTVRRRVLRPSPVQAVADPRQAARNARQRQRLEKDRIALKRWLTRLKRATNSVADLYQRISRLEAALNGAGNWTAKGCSV